MAGCGCKKNNQAVNNQTITVQLTEGNTNSSPQEITVMDKQINEIIDKIEELTIESNEEQTPQ